MRFNFCGVIASCLICFSALGEEAQNPNSIKAEISLGNYLGSYHGIKGRDAFLDQNYAPCEVSILKASSSEYYEIKYSDSSTNRFATIYGKAYLSTSLDPSYGFWTSETTKMGNWGPFLRDAQFTFRRLVETQGPDYKPIPIDQQKYGLTVVGLGEEQEYNSKWISIDHNGPKIDSSCLIDPVGITTSIEYKSFPENPSNKMKQKIYDETVASFNKKCADFLMNFEPNTVWCRHSWCENDYLSYDFLPTYSTEPHELRCRGTIEKIPELQCRNSDWYHKGIKIILSITWDGTQFVIKTDLKEQQNNLILFASGTRDPMGLNLNFKDDRGSLSGLGAYSWNFSEAVLNLPEAKLKKFKVNCFQWPNEFIH